VQMPSPAHARLALRLRRLRREQWPDVSLTQHDVARALSGSRSLGPAAVSSWESLTAPKVPPAERLMAYARFFATRRSIEDGPRLLDKKELTDDEKRVCRELEAELIALRDAALGGARSHPDVTIRRTWNFSDSGPVTIVCAQLPAEETGSLADRADPNYSELLSFADLDAMVELHGHLRAENPAMDVFFKAATKVAPDDLSGHLILLGGIAWNDITRRLLGRIALPVTQVSDPAVESGEIFVVTESGKRRKLLPGWAEDDPTELVEDVGMLARVPNPINTSRTLTVCNGIHSRGVYGAVRALTDAQLRDQNERYLFDSFGVHTPFAVLFRVQVIQGQTMTPDFMASDTVLYTWSRDQR
jgi:hypothetical protein